MIKNERISRVALTHTNKHVNSEFTHRCPSTSTSTVIDSKGNEKNLSTHKNETLRHMHVQDSFSVPEKVYDHSRSVIEKDIEDA